MLSAYGAAFLASRIRHPVWRPLAGVLLGTLLIAEYAASPSLEPAPAASRVDSLLSNRAPAVIVEFPLQSRRGFWGSLDSIYMYQGMDHFQRMLNGYSGHAPQSFYQMRDALTSFPTIVR